MESLWNPAEIRRKMEMEIAKSEKNTYVIRGRIQKIKKVSPNGSSIVLACNEEKKTIKTDKTAAFWKEQMDIDPRVTIKGIFAEKACEADHILYVLSEVAEQAVQAYAGNDQKKNLMAERAIGEVDDGFRQEMMRKYPKIALTLPELTTKFILLSGKYALDTRNMIDRYLKAYDRATHDEKERIKKRLSLLVNYVPGVREHMLRIKPGDVRKVLDAAYPGQRGMKEQLLKQLQIFQMDPQHRAPRILIRVAKKYDIQRLILAFYDALGLPCISFGCAGMNDSVNLLGSSTVYSNCCAGGFADSLVSRGAGGIWFKDVDMAEKPESLMAIQNMIDGHLQNDILEAPIDIRTEWIIMTCAELDRIPFDISGGVVLLEAEDFSKDEMLQHEERLEEMFCREHKLQKECIQLSMGVKTQIAWRYSRKNHLCDLREHLHDIMNEALMKWMDHPATVVIDEKNLKQFFSLLHEQKHLRKDALHSIAEVQKKMMLCGDEMPDGIRERIHSMQDEWERIWDQERKKVLEQKMMELGNVSLQKSIQIDMNKVEDALHEIYGMTKVKERILDYLYAMQGKEHGRFQPLLLCGPAGVGKTTIANAIAKGLSLPCICYPFNQMSDPFDLTGYPNYAKVIKKGLLGRLLENGSLCACVLIDELDKPMTKELQNTLLHFFDRQDAYDNEYACNYGTDGVFFIATANDVNAIPYALKNRCEIIRVEAYGLKERMEMAKEYLLPRIVDDFGLTKKVVFSDEMLRYALKKYTVTGGVRETERILENILRRLMRTKEKMIVTKQVITECLGTPIVEEREKEADLTCGITNALGVTGTGGTVFRVSICHNPYGPENLITGLAKNSFLESIQVAISVASKLLHKRLDDAHLHIHFEDAGIEKDGPSAGLCILAALLSLETGIALGNVAFTGEIENSGKRILAIGGLKDKLIAADRCGIETVYIPKDNYARLNANHELDLFDLHIVPIGSVNELMHQLFANYDFPEKTA